MTEEQPKRPTNLFIHSRNSKDMGMGAMGKAPKERQKSIKSNKKKERWLLTRKTWRYMTDAGKKLIPEGALNRVEDVPKIESYFQEVCQKEPRFLLWRKGSYPGALRFKSQKRKKDRRFGGSCRTKSSSADEADDLKKGPPSDLATLHVSGGRFDIQKLKHDFLNRQEGASTSKLPFKPLTTTQEEEPEETQLAGMLEKFLNIAPEGSKTESTTPGTSQIDYQELIDRLKHLSENYEQENRHQGSSFRKRIGADCKEGTSHTHKELYETLNRHFSKSTSRDKVISDVLTDRKLLENLYFDLRKSRGFGTNRPGSVKTNYYTKPQWRVNLLQEEEKYDSDDESDNEPNNKIKLKSKKDKDQERADAESPLSYKVNAKNEKIFYFSFGIQTDPIPDNVLLHCEEEYKKQQQKVEEEAKESAKSLSPRRRSSVDNDDVSQSVSDTIKRYLRMARKKSSDKDAADRFKRINYDKNLRNIKAKNIVDSPSESDETNKGTQTEDLWVPSYREHKAYEILSSPSDFSSCDELLSPTSKTPSTPTSPPGFLSSSQNFISHLLHGNKHDKSAAPAMQKSKSSSSVVHHGSRLVAKKIFRSRSKSQSRLQSTPCSWTPQGGCTWTHSVSDRQVILNDCSLLHLTEIERRILQKVALAKLQALNLGVAVRPPSESIGQTVNNKSKRRAYLLRRKAKTTGFFDGGNKTEKDKEKNIRRNRFKRIAGGQAADKNQWEFIVAVTTGIIQICAGSVIKPNWVLSASQCVRGDFAERCKACFGKLNVRPGTKDLANQDITNMFLPSCPDNDKQKLSQKKVFPVVEKQDCIEVSKVFLSDQNKIQRYATKQETISRDITLLKLSKSIDKVTPIKPPSKYQEKDKLCYIAGWGYRGYGDKDGVQQPSGLVFGIPLSQCIENDRISARLGGPVAPVMTSSTGGSDGHSVATGDSGDEHSTPRLRHTGSRSSFSSLVDAPRNDDSGSCESLMSRDRIAGSVPGLLDALSGSSEGLGLEETPPPGVPHILQACLHYLQSYGLHTLGIFRVSSSKKRVRQLREDFDSGKETVLDEEQCPHDVATLLKEYLRDLPDPLLCRELYQPFIMTQRIRNRRLQLEAIQHLVQLLPASNRDTLSALLGFLANVARHSNDTKDATGEWVSGNKMDSNNLATIFAPNILHCLKPNQADSSRSEDRIDVINVVRCMIDHHQELFNVSAELLDEVYIHMMDTYPEVLDRLLSKRDFTFPDELIDEADLASAITWTPNPVVSTDPSVTQEQKKTVSREEFLHEFAGMGGPRIRDRDRGRERSSKKRWRDESGTRRRVEELTSPTGNTSSSLTIVTRFLQKEEETNPSYMKLRSASMDSTNSTQMDDSRLLKISNNNDDRFNSERRQSSPLLLDNSGVITASLKIPVQTTTLNLDDSDIPYIEDGSGSYSEVRKSSQKPTVPPRRRQRSISGSDSSQTSNVFPITGSLSLVGYDSAVGSSTFSSPPHNTPSSVGSSLTGDNLVHSSPPSWGSSPPTSPDGLHTVNYIEDMTRVQKGSLTTQKLKIDLNSKAPILQKVSITSTSELQQAKKTELIKREDIKKEDPKPKPREKFSASISSIGGKVLRSKTEDFEKILKAESKAKTSTTASEKKKYTKRRYTDSRHETRHIPDSEDLAKTEKPKEKSSVVGSPASRTSSQQSGLIYKRRELIASSPKT